MKKRFALILAICCFCLSFVSAHAQEQAKKIRILGIGNSFTVNATKFLPQIFSSDKDVNIDIAFAQIGGCHLERHAKMVEASKKDPESAAAKKYSYNINGKRMGNQSLKHVLEDGKWDYVTIQQVSYLSWKENSYFPHAQILYDYIKELQPDATIVFHETWSYEKDSPRLASWKIDQQYMYDHLHAAYQKAADKLGILIIPVGTSFQNARKLPMWTFVPDTTFDKSKAQYPDKLPDYSKSLNGRQRWTKNKKTGKWKIYHDSYHANSKGEYLGGLVWYQFFTGKDPRNITYKPSTVSDEEAKSLKQVAYETTSAVKTVATPAK